MDCKVRDRRGTSIVASWKKAGIRVQANRVTTVDPRLELGAAGTRIEVSGQSRELLVMDSPLRGGNFQPRDVRARIARTAADRRVLAIDHQDLHARHAPHLPGLSRPASEHVT